MFQVDGVVRDIAVHGGFVEVSGNKVSILSDVAELADEIDVERARAAKDRAEEQIRHEDDAKVVAAHGCAPPRQRPPQRRRHLRRLTPTPTTCLLQTARRRVLEQTERLVGQE